MLLFRLMLLPLIGFVLGCVIFSVLGWAVLALVPSFRFSIANLMLFVVGAFLGSMTFMIAYGRFFANSNHEFTSGWTFVGMFAVMFIGAVLGGSVLAWLKVHFRKQPRTTSTY
jgi:fatty-acid desaturase